MKEKTADIDILEKYLKETKKLFEEVGIHSILDNKERQAISNLIAENKELKEEKIELQKYMKEKLIPKSTINLCYIPKSKVEELIEELEDYIQHSANPLSIDNSKFAIKVLQSFLGKE